MSDIDTTEEVQEQVEEVEAPQIDPEVAERLKAEAKAEIEAEYSKKERDLQRGFEEIAERERRLAAPPVQAEPVPELDPEAERAVSALIERQYGSRLASAEQAMEAIANDKLKAFAAEKGVEAGALRETIAEFGLVRKPGLEGVEDAIEAAYRIQQSKTFDPEAERARIREELLAEAQGGVRVEGITPRRGTPAVSSNEDVHEMSTADRMAYYKEKYPDIYPD